MMKRDSFKYILKYKTGQERSFLIEKSDFESSIFIDRYKQALNLIEGYVNLDDDHTLKCVAFCGDRGEGKTSCMSSVRGILESIHRKDSEAHRFVSSLNLKRVRDSKALLIDTIDPSFFDDSHNVLEIIIGQLYNAYLKVESFNCKGKTNDLMTAFSEVSRSLKTISSDWCEALNSLQSLSVLAAGITLRNQICNLVKCFLSFTNSDYLVISIDDIDLDVAHAYQMCEQIRKYLCVPKCIVLLSVKVRQLQNVVGQALRKSIDENGKSDSFIENDHIKDMAKKFLNKFLPVTCRVEMPKVGELEDIGICFDTFANGKPKLLQDALVEMIFNRTRFLFYNPVDGRSPIIPNNLRDLNNLAGLLNSMTAIPDSREERQHVILAENKHLFKYFFFTVWKNRFDSEVQGELDLILDYDFGTSFNREVISILNRRFEPYLKKDYYQMPDDESGIEFVTESSDGLKRQYSAGSQSNSSAKTNASVTPTGRLVESIRSDDNFGYNLTIGDVFYLFSFLESDTLKEEDYALLFFLKSLYSIKMCEAYDVITEKEGMLYPKVNEKEDEKGLSIIDHRFDNTNKLQQLTGGSLFTYFPGDILPLDEGKNGRDLRMITGEDLYALLSRLKGEFHDIKILMEKENRSDDENTVIADFSMRLRIAEFFILTVKCAVKRRKIIVNNPMGIPEMLEGMRMNINPFHYGLFTKDTKNYMFDVTAPFGNLINVEYCYRRFDLIDEEMFSFIMDFEGSLLHDIMERGAEHRKYIRHDDTKWKRMHRMLSDCVIRNAEVLSAVKNNMLAVNQERVTNDSFPLMNFYGKILDSSMKTQRRSEGEDPDTIAFNFLDSLEGFLKLVSGKHDDEKGKEYQELFLSIYRVPKSNNMAASKEGKVISDITSSLHANSDKLPFTLEQLLDLAKRKTSSREMRIALKTLDYFKDYTDEMLKEVIPDKPDGSTKYTTKEIRDILKKWYEDHFGVNKSGADLKG